MDNKNLTLKEYAKWLGVCTRRARAICEKYQEITGAYKHGRDWNIPHPIIDPRKRQIKKVL